MAAPEGSILPLEMLLKIFSYLEVQEIEKSVAPVCRLWRDASRLPVVRRRLTLPDKISLEAAEAMLRRSPLLTELTIDDRYDNDDLLRTVATHNVKLRVLTINSDVSDIGLEAIAQCSQLHTLSLRYMSDEVTDDGAVHLARLPHLEKLSLWGAHCVTPAGWRRLLSECEWPNLRELFLRLYSLASDVAQLQFERLHTTLRSLILWGCMSDIDLEAVAQCDQLRTLLLYDVFGNVTDDGVVHLVRLRHLEKFLLKGVDSVTPAGWRHLFSMCEWPHLRELSLEFDHPGREVPQVHFERLPTTLLSLELQGPVSDMDLVVISHCSQLRTLFLRSLSYIPCHITDDGVAYLAGLRHLEKLVLIGANSVTPAGWRRLLSVCEWPHMRELHLPYTLPGQVESSVP